MRGAADRAVFVIDRLGKIKFSRNYSLREVPSLNHVLLALRDI
jgi:peroxiredoxin